MFFYEDILSVKNYVKKFNLKKTFIHKAYFPEQINIKIKSIKICHIDVNTYADTKKVFNFVKKK